MSMMEEDDEASAVLGGEAPLLHTESSMCTDQEMMNSSSKEAVGNVEQKKKRSVEDLGRKIRDLEPRPPCLFPWANFNCFGLNLNLCKSGGGSPDDNPSHSDDLLDESFLQWQKELAALPPEVALKLHQDMYGSATGSIEEETPELCQDKLQALQQVLQTLPLEEKQAYLWATQQDSDSENNTPYVSSQDYHLMFLRSTDWDVIAAANHLVKFMQLKLELFGREKLSKRITLDDLNDDDKASLQAGAGTFCGTDAAGRAIMVQRHQQYKFKTPANLVRAMYYTRMSHIEASLQTQRLGMVSIFYNVGYYPIYQKVPLLKAIQLIKRLHVDGPFKILCLHHCHNNYVEQEIWKFMHLILPRKERITYNRIVGDDAECLLKLMTFGIPVQQLNHAGWYPTGSEECRNDELSQIFSSTMATVAQHDKENETMRDVTVNEDDNDNGKVTVENGRGVTRGEEEERE